MSDRSSPSDPDRGHYSYTHYANRSVAEGFDALRFSGPVGRFLAQTQESLLVEALAPRPGRHIVDVGTGTGRAAIGLAARGATVLGLDASAEMLLVARDRAASAGTQVKWGIADAHHLPMADRSADATVCLRVLMHAIDWRQCVAELCRVSRWRVVVDFPALGSAAAIESGVRSTRKRLGASVEAYRVLAERDVIDAFAANGFRVVMTRRQFVLPIALHKAAGMFGFTRNIERAFSAVGLLRLLGTPVTMVAER